MDTLAAVYLTASVEAILEDLVTQCASSAAAAAATNTSSSSSRAGEAAVTAILLEQVRKEFLKQKNLLNYYFWKHNFILFFWRFFPRR